MTLPSAHLPEKYRSALRFFIVGTTGMFVQTWIFMGFMALMHQPDKGTLLYYVAFGMGYLIEMVINYFFSNWYTFGTRPNLTNLGGFIGARAINLVIQFVCLPILIRFLPTWNNDVISYVCIFAAGIINYFILRFFFKKRTS